MLIPIRCYTCNKLIADKWDTHDKDNPGYINLLKMGLSKKDALDRLGITRYCCRRMFLTQPDLDILISNYT